MMKLCILLVLCAMALLPCRVEAKSEKKALMLAVFGTSTEASLTFDELLPLVRDHFPDRTVVVPYTSATIRNKLNAGISDPAKKILSPEEMLSRLRHEGYTDIAVASTLIVPGVEHEKLRTVVDAFRAANQAITVIYTPPLLADKANLSPVVATLGKYLLPGASNVVVAHGTHTGHAAEATYLDLAREVAARYASTRVGSIEGLPDMSEVLEGVRTSTAGDVRFVVCMFVAGDHAENDIVSDDKDSLFSAVKGMGKTPSVARIQTKTGSRIASLGLDPDYRSLLLDHYVRHIGK